MKRTLSILFALGLLIAVFAVVGCWGTSGEVVNNSNTSTFVPSPMPETDTADPDKVRIMDKSPTGPRKQLPPKTGDAGGN